MVAVNDRRFLYQAVHEVSEPYVIIERLGPPGLPPHEVRVDQSSLQPLGCSCEAGQQGLLCWAALDVVGDECVDEAIRRCSEVMTDVPERLSRIVSRYAPLLALRRTAKARGRGPMALGTPATRPN